MFIRQWVLATRKLSSVLHKINHYDGKRFLNQYPYRPNRTLKEVFQWLSNRTPPKWPKNIQVHPHTRPQQPVEGDVNALFVNHSTVLVQYSNLNVLTDPIWSKRCSPLNFLGPKRMASPGIHFENLPAIDLVLITHNHYDHLDLPTLKKLQKKHHPLFIVSQGNRKLLLARGLKNVIELDWWQTYSLDPSTKVTYVPGQHFSRRGIRDENRSLWGGYVIEKKDHYPIYFAGDTGMGTHFAAIRSHFGKMGLSFLPIGAFEPRWFMQYFHMNPEDAVMAHLILESSNSMGIHFGTFPMADESYEDPILQLKEALEKYNIPKERFVALKNGEIKTWNLAC